VAHVLANTLAVSAASVDGDHNVGVIDMTAASFQIVSDACQEFWRKVGWNVSATLRMSWVCCSFKYEA
jgi:hypothetical protein